MQNSEQHHNNCLVCGSPKLKTLQGFEAAHLVKCGKCGFVFSHQIPTLIELEEYYDGYGRNDYLSPITIKRYNELLDIFEQERKNNKIIDVGCGIGYFLEEAIKRNWQAYGTEFTDEAMRINNEKGINMQKGVLDPENYPTGEFDIITSFEVIEHINNPQEEITNFNKILRKGGLLYITTPNFNSLLRHYLKDEYNIITYPEHLSYYTPATLHKLLKAHGFKKVWIKTTGISFTRFKRSTKRSDEKLISKTSTDEKLRQSFETSQGMNFAKDAANTMLTLMGTGDTIKALYRKV